MLLAARMIVALHGTGSVSRMASNVCRGMASTNTPPISPACGTAVDTGADVLERCVASWRIRSCSFQSERTTQLAHGVLLI